MSERTTRLLDGMIPTLTANAYLGASLPRLLTAAGCEEVELEVVPVVLQGWDALEAIVPIT